MFKLSRATLFTCTLAVSACGAIDESEPMESQDEALVLNPVTCQAAFDQLEANDDFEAQGILHSSGVRFGIHGESMAASGQAELSGNGASWGGSGRGARHTGTMTLSSDSTLGNISVNFFRPVCNQPICSPQSVRMQISGTVAYNGAVSACGVSGGVVSVTATDANGNELRAKIFQTTLLLGG